MLGWGAAGVLEFTLLACVAGASRTAPAYPIRRIPAPISCAMPSMGRGVPIAGMFTNRPLPTTPPSRPRTHHRYRDGYGAASGRIPLAPRFIHSPTLPPTKAEGRAHPIALTNAHNLHALRPPRPTRSQHPPSLKDWPIAPHFPALPPPCVGPVGTSRTSPTNSLVGCPIANTCESRRDD